MIRLARPSGPPGPRTVATAWAIATFVALVALQGAPGISRDEGAVIAGARRGISVVRGGAPPLGPAASGAVHAVASAAGASERRAYRLASALAGAALSALLAWGAFALSGPAAAALAPALFWLSPRTLHAGLVATPDVALAALALGAVLLWRRAAAAPFAARAAGTSAAAGLLLGAATLARA
ncbi:MAG TPA: phospholipid carrier-dependent glycosyltransferase, partial [Anaeromyxobacter sp.]|nr:phospholipid carrier-dependent glycosyltransferase [Anaeromyxobacter sp.]